MLNKQTLDAQTALDLMVLAMPAPAVLEAIATNLEYFNDMGDLNNLEIARMLVVALDGMYGADTFSDYKQTKKEFWK